MLFVSRCSRNRSFPPIYICADVPGPKAAFLPPPKPSELSFGCFVIINRYPRQ